MKRDEELYFECRKCETIEDCPHPDVSKTGQAIPPDLCRKKEGVILTQRIAKIVSKYKIENHA